MIHERTRGFTMGVDELDALIGGIVPPYTILIEGHPGAGKTTLGSSICYHNALRGKKCLYVSFYEDKDKLYSYMDKLGIRLTGAESKGLLRFLKLPVSMDIDSIIDSLNKVILEGFQVVVVDSITIILESLKENAEKRAWLLNYFYQLSRLVNGLIVLISELPYGEERLSLSSAEFMADAIFILKHRIEDKYLVRLLEIRKVRGAPIHVAEIPFTIVEDKGILLRVQPKLEEIHESLEEIDLPCKVLREKLRHLHRGFLVNILYPPDAVYGSDTLVFALALAVKHDLKMLLLSYITSPNVLRDSLVSSVAKMGLTRELAEKIVDEYVVFRAVNPFAYSLVELAMKEDEIVNSIDPDIVVFHGVHVPMGTNNIDLYFKELYRQMLYYKKRNKIVIRIGSCINDSSCNLHSSIADATIKITRVIKEDKITTLIHAYRRFVEPEAITSSELDDCLRECLNFIRVKAVELYSRN
jgi:circadian clock protein KaiC